jgi:NhaA family Na+:H+ antiporter
MSSPRRTRTTFQRFIASETSGGLVLMASAVLALVVANSPFADDYVRVLHTKLAGLDLEHWINDGLMTLFFLLVGLEIKREMVEGQLDTWPRRTLPVVAALGGMIVPALIYMAINLQHPENWRGWAIPTATDIAFSLGVLSLFAARVPASLKVFLTSLAIIDDLGAILIIATVYATDLSLVSLAVAALFAAILYWLNRTGEMRLFPYLLAGICLWGAMLFSGIHASLAGVVLAMAIPLGATGENHAPSPLHTLERALAPWVAFLVLPIFGFANAGVSLAVAGYGSLASPLGLGVILGLFIGKQAGIGAAVYLAYATGAAALPTGASWRQIYGVAVLCGIGFTMSLFIGLLAFDDLARQADVKLAVLVGSLLSAILGGLLVMNGGETPREDQRSAPSA